MRIFIYIRCSHVTSSVSGLGMEAQEKACRAYIEYLKAKREYAGAEIAGVYVDSAVSAYSVTLMKRPQGSKLWSELQRGDHVVFARLDRGFRWVPDFYETYQLWQDRGITLHFADMAIDMSTSHGKMFAGFMAVIAEWQSNYISERTKEGLAMSNCPKRPTAPWGYKVKRDKRHNKWVFVKEPWKFAVSKYLVLCRLSGLSQMDTAGKLRKVLVGRSKDKRNRKKRYLPYRDALKHVDAKWAEKRSLRAAELWPDLYVDRETLSKRFDEASSSVGFVRRKSIPWSEYAGQD